MCEAAIKEKKKKEVCVHQARIHSSKAQLKWETRFEIMRDFIEEVRLDLDTKKVKNLDFNKQHKVISSWHTNTEDLKFEWVNFYTPLQNRRY